LCNRPLDGNAFCESCDVGWRLGVHDPVPDDVQVFGSGPMLVPSRRLTEEETKRIYSRPAKGNG
jgi:hypothetical protein